MPAGKNETSQQVKTKRRGSRKDVELKGHMAIKGRRRRVVIGDITGSGAMLILRNPPAEGAATDLEIEGFGRVKIEVAYSGDGVCGVIFTHPTEHRDELLNWLKQQLSRQPGPTLSA